MPDTLTDTLEVTPRADADQPAGPEVDPLMISNYSLEEPSYDECHAEFWRFYQIPEGEVDPGGKHAGQFVACFDGVVRGYDESELALRDRVATELRIHPARIAVSHLLGSDRLGGW